MLRFMKNKILIPLLVTVVLAAFFSFKYSHASGPVTDERRKLVLETVMKTMESGHFSPKELDDTFSSRVYNRALSTFDYEKLFFTNQDIQRLKAYQFSIDDQIRAGSLEFFDSLDAIYTRRVTAAEKFYPEILSKPFSFTSNETYQPSPTGYAEDESALNERWRSHLKYVALSKYIELKNEQDKRKQTRTLRT